MPLRRSHGQPNHHGHDVGHRVAVRLVTGAGGTLARSLASGARGQELADYGAALVALASARHGTAATTPSRPPANHRSR